MTQKPLNICLVAPLPPPYGGIAHWTQMIVRQASQVDGLELVSINTAPTWRSIHDNGIIVRSFGGALQLLRDCVRITRFLAVRRFDALHLTTSGHLASLRDLAVSFLAAYFRVGLVYHIRFGRIPAIAEGRSLEWRLIRKVMRRAAKVIVIDAATFKAVRRAEPRANVVLIPNCVDTKELPRAVACAGETKIALFLGWVVPTKGVTELVEAWSQLNPTGWRLDVVGPFEKTYRDELTRRNVPANLRFLGQMPHADAMKRMAACDLFILPSHTEGFPNVVLEAMALGRPIIATSVGAIPEMLADGAGEVVKSKDVGALVAALDKLIKDDELRNRIARRARERAHSLYTIEVVFDTYQEIWRSIGRRK